MGSADETGAASRPDLILRGHSYKYRIGRRKPFSTVNRSCIVLEQNEGEMEHNSGLFSGTGPPEELQVRD